MLLIYIYNDAENKTKMKPKHLMYCLVEIKKKIMILFMTVVKDQQPNQMMLVRGPGSQW